MNFGTNMALKNFWIYFILCLWMGGGNLKGKIKIKMGVNNYGNKYF